MKHLDLFSGAGGFALAASWVWPDHRVAAFCEIDRYAQRVLRRHWPETLIVDDIHTLSGYDYADIDLLTGGFPCQPFSTAGKRRGAKDDRALWPEMLRIIHEAKPRWVVGENVVGFIGMGLDGAISDLEGEGYEVGTVVLPALAVDAPHIRSRVWIIAHCNDKGQRQCQGAIPDEPGRIDDRAQTYIPDANGVGADDIRCWGVVSNINGIDTQEECGWEHEQHGVGGDSYRRSLPDTQSVGLDTGGVAERGVEKLTESRIADPQTLGDGDRPRLEGWIEYRDGTRERSAWSGSRTVEGYRLPEPGILCVDDGLSAGMDAGGLTAGRPIDRSPLTLQRIPKRSAQIKLMGNAIVPQVAERIFRVMRSIDDLTLRCD